MALPSILGIRKRHQTNGQLSTNLDTQSASTRYGNVSKADLKRATKTRRIATMIASFSYLLSVIFLLLVIIGNINGSGALPSIYFFKLDLADIIPQSAPNANLINSIARTIGLHDFYQVGLWNFCEGYADTGITYCSKPQRLYWFNPVKILMNELLAGATIALPTQVVQILDILRLTSQLMFGFFMAGIVLNFVLMLASFLAVRSRWVSLPFGIISCLAGLVVLAATVIGTVISLVFKIAAESQSELNIHAYVGVKMFVFMWLAVGFTGLSFIIHSGMGCCCTSQRDIKIGRKKIREKSPVASTAS